MVVCGIINFSLYFPSVINNQIFNQMSKKVIIYSTPTCHYCNMAKAYFDENNIKYESFNVLTDLKRRQEMVDKSGQLGVPVILVDDEIVVGFDKSRLAELLGIK